MSVMAVPPAPARYQVHEQSLRFSMAQPLLLCALFWDAAMSGALIMNCTAALPASRDGLCARGPAVLYYTTY